MPLTTENEIQIQKLIHRIASRLTANRTHLKYHRNHIPLVITTYKAIRDNLKTYMIPKIDDEEIVIDRHKVCAVITLSILKEKVIEVTITDGTFGERAANIMLTFLLSQAIMEDFYAAQHGKRIVFSTPTSYLIEYQKLLYNNNAILTEIANHPKSDYANVVFFLSHIFYLMELHSESAAQEV